jgi:hypothetical protein
VNLKEIEKLNDCASASAAEHYIAKGVMHLMGPRCLIYPVVHLL